MVSLPVFRQVFLLVLLGAFFLSPIASGSVSVENCRIGKGSAFSMPADTLAEFSCIIKNPDAKSHDVMIRLRPSGVNANSPRVIVPAQSRVRFVSPVYVGRDSILKVDVYEDGRRLPYSMENECRLSFVDSKNEAIGLLNDRGDFISNMHKNPQLPRKFTPVSFHAQDIPYSRGIFQNLRMLVICGPDFSGYTSAQFSAIIEYVANGGLLVFANPHGTLAAASTPLSILLPVTPLGIRKISALEGVDELLPGVPFAGLQKGQELEFLDSVENNASNRGITLARHEGFPLMCEMPYGLGTVRFIALLPDRSNFPGDNDFADHLVARTLAAPYLNAKHNNYEYALDQLTGFGVPDISAVQILLASYLALLLIAFIVFRRLRRGKLVWAIMVGIALIYTFSVLVYANKTLGKRGILTAEVRVKNALMPEVADVYVSLFVPKATTCTAEPENWRSLFGVIPQQNFLLKDQLAVSSGMGSPLDLRSANTGGMEIYQMSLAARTSRHFMEMTSPQQLVNPQPALWSLPVMTLGEEGVSMEPWKLPEGVKADMGFVVFPGGARSGTITDEGQFKMQNESSMLTNPLLDECRRAVERSYGKLRPAVVLVSTHIPKERGKLTSSSRQGKTLTLYPVTLTASDTQVTVPSELLLFTSDHAASRLLMQGNRVNSKTEIMGDYYVQLEVSLPTYLGGMTPEKATVKVELTNTGRISPRVSLLGPGNKKLAGKAMGNCEFLFEGPELKRYFHPENFHAHVMIEGKVIQRTMEEQDFSSNNWSILGLDLSVKGRLPKRLVGTEL